jgi:hypothetical protein
VIAKFVAILAGCAAVGSAYYGFTIGWQDQQELWALPVLFAFVSLIALVVDEQSRLKRNRRAREEAAQASLHKVQQQQVHGSSGSKHPF